jgi:tetratricopeptide (TPR) repeat protein
MATLRLSCPHCKARLTVLNPDRVKRAIACPRCHRSFTPGQMERASSPIQETLIDPGAGRPTAIRWFLGGGACLAVIFLAGGCLLLGVLSQPRPAGEAAREDRPPSEPPSRSTSKSPAPAGEILKKGLPAVERVLPGGKCALLVGVRDYDSSKLAPLLYTENDVEELGKVLGGPESGFVQVRLLTSSRGKKKAGDAPTAQGIRAALKELLAGRKRGDVVLVALAGHGLSLRDEKSGKDESYFCPADAQMNDQGSLVGLTDLFGQLDACGAGVKLLLVDACRNDPAQGRSMDADTLPRPPRGIAALFSCSSGERAFESPRLGKGHGVFFHFVLEGLRGKAQNEDREVTWHRLTEHVTTRVSREVPRLIGGGARQTPHLVTNLTGSSPVLVEAVSRWRRLLESGKEKLEQHHYEPAIEALSEAIQAAPPGEQGGVPPIDLALPYAYRALALVCGQNAREALADCDKALRLDGKSVVALAVRARARVSQKQLVEALADAREAVRLDARSALAYTCRSFVYLRLGETDRALADSYEAIKRAPRFALAYNDRGRCFLARKDHARAIADFEQAIQLAPRYQAALLERRNAYLDREEAVKATVARDQADKRAPADGRKATETPAVQVRPVGSPIVGVWDIVRTSRGRAALVAVFHGNGTFAFGPALSKPILEGRYDYTAKTLMLSGRTSKPSQSPVIWSASGNRLEFGEGASKFVLQRRAPAGRITTVRHELDVVQNGRKGLAIHAGVSIENAPGLPCQVGAVFLDAGGSPLKGQSAAYRNAEGFLVVRSEITPSVPSTVVKDLVLFLPYEEIALAPGKNDLRFQVNVWCHRDKKFLIDKPRAHELSIARPE